MSPAGSSFGCQMWCNTRSEGDQEISALLFKSRKKCSLVSSEGVGEGHRSRVSVVVGAGECREVESPQSVDQLSRLCSIVFFTQASR